MSRSTSFSFCRFCHAFCGVRVTIDDGVVTKVVGDVDNPMYEGFSCVKGRALPEQHSHPDRLLTPHLRGTDGSFTPATTVAALDDVAARVRDLVDEAGPRCIALYTGTYSFHYPSGAEMAKAFMRALGSPMVFNSGSIDQPGKSVARAFHGTWSAGPQPFDEADTWMIVGANPMVSMWGGVPQYNPAKRLREAKQRGLRLVVIDPRLTETARLADVFLQPIPGEDPTVLAGILRIVLEEGLVDSDFVESDVSGIDRLRSSVQPFTPEYVERRAGVPRGLLEAAARTFAAGRVGSVTAGTGPNMAPRGTLTEYLVACLQTVCGRWLRAGAPVPNPYVLRPERVSRAQADVKEPSHGFGEQLRIRGLGANASGLPASALAEEMLLPGDGQVRALFSLGGNPLAAWPDQAKVHAALAQLDLLVQLDVRWSATTRVATHAIGCRLGLETEGITLPNERVWGYGAATTGYPQPYAQWAPAVVDPPSGSDVVEEWQFFYRLAQRLGLSLRFSGVDLDMDREPAAGELLELLCAGSRVALTEVKRHAHGAMFPDHSIRVQAKQPGWTERLDVGHPRMMAELGVVAAEPIVERVGHQPEQEFPYRLVSRRLLQVYNSSGRDIARLVGDRRHNPAYLHPSDLEREGLATGDVVIVTSAYGTIDAVVEAADDIRPGVISMAHGFGDVPGSGRDVWSVGSSTARLIATDVGFDPIHGLPAMSAIPVNVQRSAANARP